jgi:peroxiredoxin
MEILKAGVPAPDFCLPSTPDQKLCLKDLRGKTVLLIFYPADWSPVCTAQLKEVSENIHRFKEHDVEILGISVDNSWCHLAFEENRKYGFQLLSDFEPKGEVAKKYGVYREKDGLAQRALFLIDPEGLIEWSYLSPVGVSPGVDGILDVLQNIGPTRQVAS